LTPMTKPLIGSSPTYTAWTELTGWEMALLLLLSYLLIIALVLVVLEGVPAYGCPCINRAGNNAVQLSGFDGPSR